MIWVIIIKTLRVKKPLANIIIRPHEQKKWKLLKNRSNGLWERMYFYQCKNDKEITKVLRSFNIT